MQKYQVLIPVNIQFSLHKHELFMADILAQHFQQNVIFITPINAYKVSTPDIILNNLEWEMKAPKTNKMGRFAKDIKYACHQSPNLVISSRRTKIKDESIHHYLLKLIRTEKRVKQIIFINSHSKVLTIT